MKHKSRWSFLLGMALSCALVGCGSAPSGPQRNAVSGKVTYKGEPVKTGTITFGASDPSKGTPASVPIKDGAYTTGDGLAVGDYTVVIQAFKRALADIPPPELATLGDSNLAVPKKYTDPKTTDLKYTVTSGTQTKDFDLAD